MKDRNVVLHHRDNKTMSSSSSSSSSSSRPTFGTATIPTTTTTVTAASKNNHNHSNNNDDDDDDDDDNNNSKKKKKINKRYGGKYLGIRTLFVLFWIVFLPFDRNMIRRGISSRFLYLGSSKSKNNPYGMIVAEHMNSNNNNNNMKNNNNNNANRTIGQKIIERSYYHSSGYHDLVTEFCPPPPPLSSSLSVQGVQQQPPSTIRQDFILNCLQKAKVEGNNPSTTFFKKWPWWFRTLLRDTVPRETGLGEPWHILQFTNVGSSSNSSTTSSDSNSNRSNPNSNSNFNSYIDNDDDNNNPRLQLCVYEKGGTKNWKRLQCAHNHNYDTNQTNNIDYNQCYQKQPPYDEQLLTLKSKSNSKSMSKINTKDAAASGGGGGGRIKSDKVVFLRDPLDRFLSGFLDKCVRRHDKGVDHCEPITIFSPSGSPIDTMLWDNQRKFQAYVDTFPLKWNMHFFPQSFYCGGLYRTIQDYDFIGTMTGNKFYDDLNRLQNTYPGLSKKGMDDIFYHLNSNSNNNNNSRRNKNNKNNIGIETGAAGKVLEYYTPHTVKRVLEYYAIDYIMLNLTIPKWVEEMLQLEETEEYIL